jgi:hypothetical protein
LVEQFDTTDLKERNHKIANKAMVQKRLPSTGTAELLGKQFPTFRDNLLALPSVAELRNERGTNRHTAATIQNSQMTT